MAGRLNEGEAVAYIIRRRVQPPGHWRPCMGAQRSHFGMGRFAKKRKLAVSDKKGRSRGFPESEIESRCSSDWSNFDL